MIPQVMCVRERQGRGPVGALLAASTHQRWPAAFTQVQVEGHPYFRNEKLRAFCAAKGVHVTAYSPLGTPETAGERADATSTHHQHPSPRGRG